MVSMALEIDYLIRYGCAVQRAQIQDGRVAHTSQPFWPRYLGISGKPFLPIVSNNGLRRESNRQRTREMPRVVKRSETSARAPRQISGARTRTSPSRS